MNIKPQVFVFSNNFLEDNHQEKLKEIFGRLKYRVLFSNVRIQLNPQVLILIDNFIGTFNN